MSRVEIGLWQLEVRAKKCVEALRKNGFDAGFYPHAESLRTRVLAECERAESIGFGGSLSIQDLGIFEALEGKGNRTNAMTFGPKKTVVVAGGQKVVSDVGEALRRIKAVAAPRNTKRLKLSTPCATSGFCEDCDSPQRICRVYSIIERKPPHSDITVLLCGEPMGL